MSRDEMATALMDVTEGRVPADRIALRELHREMVNWPFLRQDTESGEGRWGRGPRGGCCRGEGRAWRRLLHARGAALAVARGRHPGAPPALLPCEGR